MHLKYRFMRSLCRLPDLRITEVPGNFIGLKGWKNYEEKNKDSGRNSFFEHPGDIRRVWIFFGHFAGCEPYLCGDIKISVEEFEKKGTKEVLYNNKGDVLPGAVVSKIPRITNRALPCWVRARILYTNDRKELEGLDDTKLSGFSSKWIKRGEYYYYTSILKRKETVDLFQSVHIPASWKRSMSFRNWG